MSVSHVVRRLLEEPNDQPADQTPGIDDPMGLGSLEHYTKPVEFDENIKDIIQHARYLKDQAEQAGALNLIMRPNSLGTVPKQVDVDRAFLFIAVEQYDEEMRMPGKYAQLLKRHMHHIWD